MNSSDTSQLIRGNLAGWSTIASGDNDVEILECKIHVHDFSQAVDIAEKLSPLIMQYDSLDSEYVVRVNLTRWVVEIRMSVPSGSWGSEARKELAISISKLSSSKL